MQTDLSVLDELVEDYMLQEELTDKSCYAANTSCLSVRRACEQVRTLTEQGDICAALKAVPEKCQAALRDQRLIFRLKKQEVVEHLRKGTPEAQQQALDCIRHDYASLAENAYPEAYSEFKHSMLLLIFDEQLQASPVKQDWSLQTRSDMAGMLCRTLRQTAGVYPSTLSLLLRHLLLSHEAYHLHKTCTSLPQTAKEVRLLSKQLLPLSKDPPPLPCENPGGGSLGEWLLAVEDAQALVTALDLPWEEASHLLKHAAGDLSAAFKNELSAYHLNEKLLDELVWEYAAHRLYKVTRCRASREDPGILAAKFLLSVAYRGLLSLSDAERCAEASSQSTDSLAGCRLQAEQAQSSTAPQQGRCSAAYHEVRLFSRPPHISQHFGSRGGRDRHASSRHLEERAATASVAVASDREDQPAACRSEDQSQAAGSSGSRKRDAPGPSLFPEKRDPNGGCSTSGRGSSVQSPPRKVPCWKGRPPHPVTPADQSHSSSSTVPALPSQIPHQKQSCPESHGQAAPDNKGKADRASGSSPQAARHQLPHAQKYMLLHALSQQLEAGHVDHVLTQIKEELEPGFLEHHPDLLFELQRCQFHALLDSGATVQALRLVRSQLTPLSQQHPHLQPHLKASMACLLPCSQSAASSQQCTAAASALLQDALRTTLGLPQPRLLNLMQTLLEAHQGWYQLQRCKDRFEGLLTVDKLKRNAGKAAPAAAASHRASATATAAPSGDVHMADAAGNISSDHESDGGSDAGMSEHDDVVLSDDVIRITMEFTGLPRHQVMDLLLHNDGDPTAVMAQLFP